MAVGSNYFYNEPGSGKVYLPRLRSVSGKAKTTSNYSVCLRPGIEIPRLKARSGLSRWESVGQALRGLRTFSQ